MNAVEFVDVSKRYGDTVAVDGVSMDIPEGASAYQKFKPDIVTMDITMPEMNGIDAVKAIKALDANAKIVMVSAMGQQPMVIEAIQAGANDFIVKPFQPERVIEAISKVLA